MYNRDNDELMDDIKTIAWWNALKIKFRIFMFFVVVIGTIVCAGMMVSVAYNMNHQGTRMTDGNKN